MPTLQASSSCTYVTAECPVEGSPYGYYPSLPANTVFLFFWAALIALNLGLGVIQKTYSISANLTGGCVLEMIGYLGRLMLFEHPYSDLRMAFQIVAISMAPVLFLRTIYLILEQYTICHPEYCWPQKTSTVGFWKRRRAEDSDQGEDVESVDSSVTEEQECGRITTAHASTTVPDVHIDLNVETNKVDPSTRSSDLDLEKGKDLK
jgi:hypothetical protein